MQKSAPQSGVPLQPAIQRSHLNLPMRRPITPLAMLVIALAFPPPQAMAEMHKTAAIEHPSAILWKDPADIASRNLYYGPGGGEHQPQEPLTFLKEDLSGTNPKFDVRDATGTKWKVKLGLEAQPETVATRLLWAVGFTTNVTYFLRSLGVTQGSSAKKI